MNEFTDWDRALIDETDDVCGMSKVQWREKLAADTEEFIANGGEIELIPYNWQAEIAGRVGYWQAMGRSELDDLIEDDECPYR